MFDFYNWQMFLQEFFTCINFYIMEKRKCLEKIRDFFKIMMKQYVRWVVQTSTPD